MFTGSGEYDMLPSGPTCTFTVAAGAMFALQNNKTHPTNATPIENLRVIIGLKN
jgi:hypothetical protein